MNLTRGVASIFRGSLAIGRHIPKEIIITNVLLIKLRSVFWLRDSLLCPYKNVSSSS